MSLAKVEIDFKFIYIKKKYPTDLHTKLGYLFYNPNFQNNLENHGTKNLRHLTFLFWKMK